MSIPWEALLFPRRNRCDFLFSFEYSNDWDRLEEFLYELFLFSFEYSMVGLGCRQMVLAGTFYSLLSIHKRNTTMQRSQNTRTFYSLLSIPPGDGSHDHSRHRHFLFSFEYSRALNIQPPAKTGRTFYSLLSIQVNLQIL